MTINLNTAVLKVGGGRGFLVQGGRNRYVITAAHCLPYFPPPPWDLEERTYRNLLGPLGAEPTIWAECLFVDPIADIAVLGPADSQALVEQWEAFDDLVEQASTLLISDAAPDGSGFLLSLSGELIPCRLRHNGGGLW